MLVFSMYHICKQILDFLQPDRWTAAAVYQATRIFISNLNDKMAQRFVCWQSFYSSRMFVV